MLVFALGRGTLPAEAREDGCSHQLGEPADEGEEMPPAKLWLAAVVYTAPESTGLGPPRARGTTRRRSEARNLSFY